MPRLAVAINFSMVVRLIPCERRVRLSPQELDIECRRDAVKGKTEDYTVQLVRS